MASMCWHGGHLSHGYQTPSKKISAVSTYFETFPYRVDLETGRGNDTSGDQARDVGHVDDKVGANLVGNLAHALVAVVPVVL
jgi:hypothetical protein